jgi:hypothetical protein
MVRRSLVRTAPLLLALAALVATRPADAARPYPTNQCVSVKQKLAGAYCARALELWGRWDVDQDLGRLDTALAKAAAKLASRWGKAEAAAARKGVDCVDTTLAATAAQAAIDSAVGAIVDAVNHDLDLGSTAEARCGRQLLEAAGHKCAKLLRADASHVRTPERDTHGVRRARRQNKARNGFAKAWGRAVRSGCPVDADEGPVETLVDDLHARLVRDTTVSPKLSDAQFTTIDPPADVEYQGRTFHPICVKGTPYEYFVKRGSVNKLVVYYQGGGACWDNLTCGIGTCDMAVTPGDNPNGTTTGFADLTNPLNPFRDWNIVFVSYCSCDIHFGDAAQDYTGALPPIHIEHRGYQNARVVEKFAREHFVDPDRVFVTGSSAGAYGAWFNAPLLEEVWPAAHFDVLADAGNGVTTQDFLENEFPNWNFAANLPPDIPGLEDTLTNGTGIPGYTKIITGVFPETRWAHYSSAYDGGTGGQTGFYNVMLNPNDPGQWLSWWNASCAYNEHMRMQAIDTAAAVPSNYRYYIGTGSRHTMWGSNKVYTDTTGGVPTIVDWVNGMLNGTPAWSNVECTNCGLLLPGDPRPNPLVPPFTMQGADVVIDCAFVGSPSGAFVSTPDQP